MNLKNTPTLYTKRLILRQFNETDLEAFYQIFSDENVNTFLPWLPLKDKEEARVFMQERYLDQYQLPIGYHYAICLKDNNRPIGYINVSLDESHDFGYGLLQQYQHQGIVTEACQRVIEQLKKDGFLYITATHDVNNIKSGEVMKRLNMTYQYSYQELWQPKNKQVIFRMYQLNFDGSHQVFRKYWDMYPHFIETMDVESNKQ